MMTPGEDRDIMFDEKTVKRKTIYRGKVIDVERQSVILVNGNTAEREIIRHSGGACMVAVDDLMNIYLVRQYRKAIDRETIEIPAGKLEKDEDPYECAVRELKEETGLMAGRVSKLGHIYTTPGFCDEVLHIFLAEDLVQAENDPDPDEFVSCERYPIIRCLEMIENGEICDSKTIVAILRMARRFGIC